MASNDPDSAALPDLEAVERLVDAHRGAALEPGLAYGIVHHGRLLHTGGRGERRASAGRSGGAGAPGAAAGGGTPDADTVFRIASMTKSFTAATVLLLRDEGLLRLDDEVSRYVPEVADLRPPTDDAPPLTLRALLTMTAGFPTDDPWGDRQQDLPDDDLARLVAAGLSFAWTPGTVFEYSNLSYALLGRVVTAAAGEPYRDVVTRRVLGPLGMTATVWTADEVAAQRLATGHRRSGDHWEEVPFAGYGAFAPMGGLFSTVRDLARWVAGLAAAFPPSDGPHDPGTGRDHPVRRATRRELQLPHLGLPPIVTWPSLAAPPVVRGVGYGFGLVVERDPRFGTLVSHSGGYPGFGSHMRWHPASGLGVVVLGNATYTPVPRLGSQLMDALLAATESSAGPWTGRPGASPAPATGSLVAATAAARDDVTRLVTAWDDALAERLLAVNIDLDEPLAVRRREIGAIVDSLGPLAPDVDAPVTSLSPAHCVWWLRGPGGRVRVEIRLTPELPPRVQTLTVTAVPTPSAAHHRLAAVVTDLLGADGPGSDGPGTGTLVWPADVPVSPTCALDDVLRQVRVAAVWAGAGRVGEVVAGDGRREATFRLVGGRTELLLALTVDPADGALAALTFSAG